MQIGRYVPEKGHFDTVRAFKQVLEDPRVKSAMEGHTVVAIFGKGEWPYVKSAVQKMAEIKPSSPNRSAYAPTRPV